MGDEKSGSNAIHEGCRYIFQPTARPSRGCKLPSRGDTVLTTTTSKVFILSAKHRFGASVLGPTDVDAPDPADKIAATNDDRDRSCSRAERGTYPTIGDTMGMQLIHGTICAALTLTLPGYPEAEPPLRPAGGAIDTRYHEATDRIVQVTLADNDAYDKLEELCLEIGHRLSGSPQLDQAIDWALTTLRKSGAENVHHEKVTVPHWVRGRESATMIKPRLEPLHILGLGSSVSTPPEGITAPVVVVQDEDALNALGEGARGKIVLFNKAMPPYDPGHGSGYGAAVKYRTHGARLAAEKGAVACLVRSATARSLRSPHTGAMQYGDASVKIPAAAVSLEDAQMLARLQDRKVPTVVTLQMEAKTLPDAESANVIGELRGSTLPDEVVVIGGHLDSWDVGHGAHDDGGGCVAAMEVINVLRKLNMIPRRTIRVVLWTNEENGLRGGNAYAKDHADELDNHVAAIEFDSGVFRPTGYSVQCQNEDREAIAAEQMRDILNLLSPHLSEMNITTGWSGADIGPMREAGFVLLGHRTDGSHYFDYHHSHADTLDKVDANDLSRNVAVLAAVTYVLADMPARLGER